VALVAEQPLVQVSPVIVINLGANSCLVTQDLQIVACVAWSDPIWLAGSTEPILALILATQTGLQMFRAGSHLSTVTFVHEGV
jgi:hypothetical protein